MRFFATRQKPNQGPPTLLYACRRSSGAGESWGAVGHACGAGRRGGWRRCHRVIPAAPTTCAAASSSRLHHDAVAADWSRALHAHTYSPPLPRTFHNGPREKRPRLPQQIQFRIELPPDTLDHSDGHDRRREVGFQADAVPPARR